MLELVMMAGVAGVADLLAGAYDAAKSDQGIKKGVAIEDNSLIVKLFGSKPSVHQLDAFNVAQTGVFLALTAAALLSHNPALIGGALGLLFASAGVHIRGARNWAYLVAGGNPNLKQTAFQKFVGFLSWNEG